jgi:serine/threonine protein kinase
MDMEMDDDCLSVASTQTGEIPFPMLSLSPPAQPSLVLHRHETSISREPKYSDVIGLQFNRTSSKGGQPMKASAHKSKSGDLRLKNLIKVREVGRGSSGVVYHVHDRPTGQVWALKEISLPADEEKRRMIVDELRTAHGVDHANIVSCCEVFYSRGVFSLVMDFMDGGSLLDNLKAARGRLMPLSALAHIGRSVAAGLAHLHEELGVVHRDVKPGNILLSCLGDVKLADLGICTRPGELRALPSPKAAEADGAAEPATAWVGTVTYMSPERLTGSGYSFSADVWSLGIVLAESALGRYPYCLSPTARPTAGPEAAAAAEARALQFWDLLDLVLDGPCPSRAVAAECAARSSPDDAQVTLMSCPCSPARLQRAALCRPCSCIMLAFEC